MRKVRARLFSDPWFVVGIFIFVLGFRIAYSITLDISVDTISRWYLPTIVARTGSWDLLLSNIWSSRWGLTVPQVAISYLTLGRVEGYYILPLFSFSLATTLTCIVLKKYAGVRQSLVFAFAVLVSVNPTIAAWSSQLCEYPIGYLYVISSIYFFLRYLENNHSRNLVACFVFAFLAYATQLLFIAFLIPPLVVLLLKCRYRSALLGLITLTVLFSIEFLGFFLLSDGERLAGRFSGIAELLAYSVEASVRAQEQEVFHGLYFSLSRWFDGARFNLLVGGVFLLTLGGAMVAYLRTGRGFKPVHQLFTMSALSYAFLITLLPKTFDPYMATLDLSNKYEYLAYPLFSAFSIGVISSFSRKFGFKKVIDRTVIVISSLLLFGFIYGSENIRCSSSTWKEPWRVDNLAQMSFCTVFFVSRGPDNLPQPARAFALSSDSAYRSIYYEYENGNVALPINTRGLFWLSVFDTLDPGYTRGQYSQTGLSVDGLEKEYCLDEITSQDEGGFVPCSGPPGTTERLIKIANAEGQGLSRDIVLQTLLKGY